MGFCKAAPSHPVNVEQWIHLMFIQVAQPVKPEALINHRGPLLCI
jgi:hypothetical protein